ncbi:MAG: LuxR C-terminal-related transcriptional regulator [Chloroflexota bacterium]
MSPPILATKLYIPPPRSKIVLRPRLIAQLNAGRQRHLTLISAPAGFGKTTLLSRWIYDLQTKDVDKEKIINPVAWLSLDKGDNDPTRFLTYSVAALQTIAPHLGIDVLALLQSPQPSSTETILTLLLNEIATNLDNFTLILDDYHLIENRAIDEALAFMLEHLPPSMHLVIATREDPSLPLARLRVRDQITELRANDLRFTATEAAEFLNQVMDLTLSTKDIQALETRTEGWIAGLQLAGLALQGLTLSGQREADRVRFIKSFTGSHRFILDYLVEEILQQQPDIIQTFLLNSSILDRLCGPLCEAVCFDETGGSSASGQEMLEQMERANLLVVPLDNERVWYRYHHLFSDVLQARLMKKNPDQIPVLHQRASIWYEQNHLPFDAIRHALAAKNFERAATLIELEAPAMRRSYQDETLISWIKALPEAIIQNRPVLSMAYAWGLLGFGEIEAGITQVNRAEAWLDQSGEATEMIVVDNAEFHSLRASIAAARAFHAGALSDVPSTIRHAQQALALLPNDDYFQRAIPAALLGIAYWANGELEIAHQTLADGLESLKKEGHVLLAIAGTSMLARIRGGQGRLKEAIRRHEEALRQVADIGYVFPGLAELHAGLGELLCEQGRRDRATQQLLKWEALGPQAIVPGNESRLYASVARIQEAQGNLKEALEYLDQGERLYKRDPIPDVRPIAALRARIWLKQGNLVEAIAWVQESGLSITDELNYLQEFEHITLAKVLIAQAKKTQDNHLITEVMTLLDRLLREAKVPDRVGSILEILIVQAVAQAARKNTQQALILLEQALALAEPEQYIQIFIDEGSPMEYLLSKMVTQGEMTAYIDRLLVAFDLEKTDEVNPQAASPHLLIDPLTQRELEVLQLIAQGLSNREISERLFLALDTVKGHNRRIYGKLQVQRRTEAVARARELGLL